MPDSKMLKRPVLRSAALLLHCKLSMLPAAVSCQFPIADAVLGDPAGPLAAAAGTDCCWPVQLPAHQASLCTCHA